MAKKILVTSQGFASCPSCLTHVRVEDDLQEVCCPFCDKTFSVHHGPDEAGTDAFKALRHSRTGVLAAALAGAGLTLTVACSDDPGPDPVDPYNNIQDYNGFPNQHYNYEEPDVSYDVDEPDAEPEGDVGDAGEDHGDAGEDHGDAGEDNGDAED